MFKTSSKQAISNAKRSYAIYTQSVQKIHSQSGLFLWTFFGRLLRAALGTGCLLLCVVLGTSHVVSGISHATETLIPYAIVSMLREPTFSLSLALVFTSAWMLQALVNTSAQAYHWHQMTEHTFEHPDIQPLPNTSLFASALRWHVLRTFLTGCFSALAFVVYIALVGTPMTDLASAFLHALMLAAFAVYMLLVHLATQIAPGYAILHRQPWIVAWFLGIRYLLFRLRLFTRTTTRGTWIFWLPLCVSWLGQALLSPIPKTEPTHLMFQTILLGFIGVLFLGLTTWRTLLVQTCVFQLIADETLSQMTMKSETTRTSSSTEPRMQTPHGLATRLAHLLPSSLSRIQLASHDTSTSKSRAKTTTGVSTSLSLHDLLPKEVPNIIPLKNLMAFPLEKASHTTEITKSQKSTKTLEDTMKPKKNQQNRTKEEE